MWRGASGFEEEKMMTFGRKRGHGVESPRLEETTHCDQLTSSRSQWEIRPELHQRAAAVLVSRRRTDPANQAKVGGLIEAVAIP